ncbi:MAG: hypothetical protein MMC23_001728 [Stictis urceolatum]|nr:hypothetical protein [Stictis urceolata]
MSLPESSVDVLIIGAGPAGLMAATWMSRYGIKTRIVDKRGTKVWKESNHMLEICLWNPDSEGNLKRTDRIPDTIPGISRFQQVVLHQGRIERFFLDSLKEHSDISVERGVLPESLSIDEAKVKDFSAYPITIKLRRLNEDEATPAQGNSHTVGEEAPADGLYRSNLAGDDTDDLLNKASDSGGCEELVHAKFMIGCDGAHSWTRRQLGWSMEGEQTDYIWGVLDIIPITDFPDIRMRCAIHSASSGSVMVIPRENKLVRLYIQLTETSPTGGKFSRESITPSLVLSAAQRIFTPYTLTYHYCDWWTAYQIGQRVSPHFSHKNRIFLAGDAVHTHSPKAGQGMNVSMQDTYNLGWKVAGVVKGVLRGGVLGTYESERRSVARDLIAFDQKFSRLFSGRPAKDAADEAGISLVEFKRVFETGNLFASGLSVDYGGSCLVAKEGVGGVDGWEGREGRELSNGYGKAVIACKVVGKQHLATGVKIGMRFPSFQVLNQADARPWQFQQWFPSDGRWRVVVFAGNILHRKQLARVNDLGAKLAALESFVTRHAPDSDVKKSLIEVLVLHCGERTAVELADLHEVYRPFSETKGWDYNKIFVDAESYHEGFGDAYKGYGVDKANGCVVAVRPDQYVGWIGELEDWEDINVYFGGFFRARQTPKEETRG